MVEETVTFVVQDVGPVGGMERQMVTLIEGLLERGWHITVIARRLEMPSDHRLRHIRIRGPRRPFVIGYPWFVAASTIAMMRHGRGVRHSTGALTLGRVDVVAVHLCHAGVRAQALHRAARASLVYGVHARAAAWLARAGERWALRAAGVRVVAAVSTGLAREVEAHYPHLGSRIRVIPNGVDADRFARPSPRRESAGLTAIFVGSEWTGKGLAIAIESVAKAPPWNLTVVGRGDVARYEQLARRLGAGRRVHFVGEVEDVAPYYAEAHAFLFPTAYETFSLVTYEAAAAGLPLLAPRVSGIEDLIVDGRNGYFIERNPDDASEKLLRLLDPSVRHALGAAAAQAAKGFTWERMIDDFDRVLGKLARGERE